MDIFEQTIFVIGGAWTCLVGFLVLGMYRQNYYAQHKARANNSTGGSKFLTAAAMNRNAVDTPPAVASSYPASATRPAGTVNPRPKENGIKLA